MRSIMGHNAKKRIQSVLAVCFWLLLWQMAGVAVGSDILLASPVSVLQVLLRMIGTAAFWRTVAFSASHMLGGFLLAVMVGVALAAAAAALPFIGILLRPLMLTVKSVPVASFIILALLWLKNAGNLSIFISFLMVLPIVYTNTVTGIAAVDPQLLELARVFRVPFARRVRYLYLPAALPDFTAACGVGLGLCWKSGVAAEVIGIVSGSIGGALYQAKIFLETSELFAWTLVIVLASLAFERVFLWLLRALGSRLTKGSGL